MSALTIEDLESLAATVEASEDQKRQRLARLCRAYVRILAAREPERFQRRPTHHGDEAGHWDSSYPPKQEYSERTGPRAIKVRAWSTEDVTTEGGFYYAWRRVTTDGGLLVDRAGTWYRAEETGAGRYGQFAAHPGDCDVDCEIRYDSVSVDDLETSDLVCAECALRAMAFPLVAEAAS